MGDGGVRVDDEDELYRRIPTWYLKKDNSISSSAFKTPRGKPDPKISVDLACLTTQQESVDRDNNGGFLLASILAKWPRQHGLDVHHRPKPDNYAHCQIEGENTNAICSQMATHLKLIYGIASAGTVGFEFPDPV